MLKDYYSILEIAFGADIMTVKKAYRKLALRYHPDRNKGEDAARQFIGITEAYEVLADPDRKRAYDAIYRQGSSKSRPANASAGAERSYEREQNEWAAAGREKAREYASIRVEELSRKLRREISLGANYIPNAIAVLLAGGGAVAVLRWAPEAFLEAEAKGVIYLVIAAALSFLAYRLFLVARSDYIVKRKRKAENR